MLINDSKSSLGEYTATLLKPYIKISVQTEVSTRGWPIFLIIFYSFFFVCLYFTKHDDVDQQS